MPQTRMIISTADLDVKVKNLSQSIESIRKLAKLAGGYVNSSSLDNNAKSSTGSIAIRIPVKNYGSAIEEIAKLGVLTKKDESAEDVTEEYIDVDSRLRNVRREESAYLNVLTSARRVTDILAVERELSRVRGEIEQAEGRIKYLRNQSELATITISFYTAAPAIKSSSLTWSFAEPATQAIHAFGVIIHKAVTLAIWLVVLSPIWGLALLAAVLARRRLQPTSGL